MLWLAGLAAITLTPGRAPVARIVSLCIVCGERGAADALLNTILFLPLGLLIGTRRGPLVALAAGVAISGGVEACQLLLAGRYSNLGDLVWNGLGAGIGAASVPWLRLWLAPEAPRRTRVLAAAVGVALPTLWLLAAGVMLRPLSSQGPYTVEGPALLESRLEGDPDGAWRLSARVPRPSESWDVRPLASIVTRAGDTVRVLGDDRGDLVLWERTAAPMLRFDYASHHLYGALDTIAVGEPVSVSASLTRTAGLCLQMESMEACELGVAPARTWTLLRSREHASERLKQRVDVAWMATLTLVLGLLVSGARGLALGTAALAVAVVSVSAVTVLAPPGWPELVGALLGIGSGALLRPLAGLFVGEPTAAGAAEGRKRMRSAPGPFGLARE